MILIVQFGEIGWHCVGKREIILSRGKIILSFAEIYWQLYG